MRWQIFLFGGLRVEGGDRTITRFQTRQAGLLLAYMAYHLERMHPRETLVELLWPECEPTAGRARLSTALSSLRRQLEPPGVQPGSVIGANRTAVWLIPEAVTTDVAAFQAGLDTAARTTSDVERAQRLADALDRYHSRLLAGYNETWIVEEQVRLAESFFEALQQLLAHWEQTGSLERAIEYARRGVSIDPLREEAHHELIRLLASTGQHAAARRQFNELSQILRREFEMAPAPATCALVRRSPEERAAARPRSLPSTVASSSRCSEPASFHGALASTVTVWVAEAQAAVVEEARPQAKKAHQRARFRRLVRRHGGCELGDGKGYFSAAFARASDALACMFGLQRTPMLFRSALHTGEVGRQESPHRSLLQHALRLLAAGHPGQVLLSEAAAALLRLDQEAMGRLTDLGVFHLTDSAPPERLYQLDDPAASPRRFPRPNALPAHAGHLPLPLDRFFGREGELGHLADRLEANRLVTLTGLAGVGKTRLALPAAQRLSETYRGIVCFVPLVSLSDPQLIPDKVLEILRLPRSPHAEPLDQLIAFLSRQPALLVLDNFEHLISEGALLVQALLGRLPALTCLITSRQRLDLPGETEIAVAPLPIPVDSFGLKDPGSITAWGSDSPATRRRLSTLLECASVRLFIDRAQAVRSDFQLTGANAAAVSGLCTRLEGLPLALELAAARIWVLTPAQMLERLGCRFELLASRQRSQDSRHRSLRAALDWSHQLLSPELQRFFASLSVFRGGWTLEAAEAIGDQPQAMEYLGELRDCSLVLAESTEIRGQHGVGDPSRAFAECRAADSSGLGMRFRMLETVREYAAEQLPLGGQHEVAHRHARYFLGMAESAEPMLRSSEQGLWIRRLELDLDNLRAALNWCHDQPEEWETELRLAGALYWFWDYGGYVGEGRNRLEQALLRRRPGDWAERTPAVAKALYGAGASALFQGDYSTARSYQEKSVAIWREVGDKRGLGNSVRNLGMISLRDGDREAARRLLQESLACFRSVSEPAGIAWAFNCLGAVAATSAEYEAARSLHTESLTIFRQIGDQWGLAWALLNLGDVSRAQNNTPRAEQFYEECVATSWQLGLGRPIVFALEGLAGLAAVRAQPERAAQLFGAVEALRETMGAPLPPSEHSEHERHVEATRSQLAAPAFAAAWTAGRAMSLDQAIQCVLADRPA